jgi:hypothetical protein
MIRQDVRSNLQVLLRNCSSKIPDGLLLDFQKILGGSAMDGSSMLSGRSSSLKNQFPCSSQKERPAISYKASKSGVNKDEMARISPHLRYNLQSTLNFLLLVAQLPANPSFSA